MFTRKSIVVFVATLVAVTAIGVVSVPPAIADNAKYDDDGHSIAAIGDGKFFIGDCTAKAVQLSGNNQHIVLFGKCKSIISEGSKNRITFDGSSSLNIVGDDNTVTWKSKPAYFKAAGRHNEFTTSLSSASPF